MLSHVLIGLNGAVSRVGHSVLSKELTEWLVWVSSNALSWLLEVKVEEVKDINVSW